MFPGRGESTAISAIERDSAHKLVVAGQLPRDSPLRCSLERGQSDVRHNLGTSLTWASVEIDRRPPIIHEDTSHRWTDGKPRVCDWNTSAFGVQRALAASVQIGGIIKTSKLLKRYRHPLLLVSSDIFGKGNPIVERQFCPHAIEWDAWQLLHDNIL